MTPATTKDDATSDATNEAAGARTSVADQARAQKRELLARHSGVLDAARRSRRFGFAVAIAMAAMFVGGVWLLDFSFWRFIRGLGDLGRIVVLMMPPDYETTARLMTYLKALAETLAIAFLGTLLASTVALPLGMMAARNVLPVWIARFVVRRTFDGIRGVDTLVWALIWINVVGLGPFAGVLAIMTSDIGALGKLFSEAIENADHRSVEGVTSTGATSLQQIRFGVLPQVIPVILSQMLYYFESNTRSATIIGIVGAGGIGLHLYEQIRTLEWQQVSFLVLLILVTVAVIDWVSSQLRFTLIGRRAG